MTREHMEENIWGQFARKRDSNKQTKTNHPKGMARIETEDRIKLLNWPVPAANREHL